MLVPNPAYLADIVSLIVLILFVFDGVTPNVIGAFICFTNALKLRNNRRRSIFQREILIVRDGVIFFLRVSFPWFAIIVTLFVLGNWCSIAFRGRNPPRICRRGCTPGINRHRIPTISSRSDTLSLGISRSSLFGLKFRTALITSPTLVNFLVRVTRETIELHGNNEIRNGNTDVLPVALCLSKGRPRPLPRSPRPLPLPRPRPSPSAGPEWHHGIHVNKMDAMYTHPSSGLFHRQQEPPLGRPESSPLAAYPNERSIG